MLLTCLGPYWNVAIYGCPPESLSRNTNTTTDFSNTPNISMHNALVNTYQGYISNYTKSTDICHQPPDLQSLHGCLIDPINARTLEELFPIFGTAKLSVNNDILLPAAMYWGGGEEFTGGNNHGNAWQMKKNQVVWRGQPTGGRVGETNWKSFHRHRFVAMINATQVRQAEKGQDPVNWAMPPRQYGIKAARRGQLAQWVDSWSDAGFVQLNCENCHLDPYFHSVPRMDMSQQFTYKFLPDIDGNSFSGRYLGFLKSNSLPIKATNIPRVA
jgi:hypothetical protein